MSLFGALFSGVSGLTAQSSAMGAISDNITNVSTIGYKNTDVKFQTLVTKQTSSTFYSAGGVQSRPFSKNDVQGLLQASTSQTDISISGNGFFVVNEASVPGNQDEFLFTRSGSFFADNEGFLRNTSGFYLQAWPTDPAGNVIPANPLLAVPNQNIISTDYLQTVNLTRVGGTAASTETIAIGANLPSNDSAGDTHRTDVQFFDTLGNANNISFVFTKRAVPNQWDVSVEPPPGANLLTIEDATGGVIKSTGQVELFARPADGATIVINGTTYEFDTNGVFGATPVDISATTSLSQDVAALVATVIATDAAFTVANGRIKVSDNSASVVTFTDDSTAAFTVDPAGLVDAAGDPITLQTQFTVRQQTVTAASIIFDSDGLPQTINIAELEINGFANGAADMDDDPANAPQITVDLGTLGEADGMTQFGSEFTPIFISQDGSRFGTFAGVTINAAGLVTALFDNGEIRPVFQIPVATFVNPVQLGSRSGNVFNQTEFSGDNTLRVADNGPAGSIVQASLEASTVDIGEEFTKMIVVQRAFSAATKIITTADEMLDELTRVKR